MAMLHEECDNCRLPHSGSPVYCSVCHSHVCASCTLITYPNRLQVGVCKNCSAMAKTHLRCGRCRAPLSMHEMEFFCDMCASPICPLCITSSLEQGLLKCIECCDSPIRSRFAESRIRCDVAQCVQAFRANLAEKLRSSSAITPFVPLPAAPSPNSAAWTSSSSPPTFSDSAAASASAATPATRRELLGRDGHPAVTPVPARPVSSSSAALSSSSSSAPMAHSLSSATAATAAAATTHSHSQPSAAPVTKYRTLLRKQKLGEGAQGVVYKCYTTDGDVVVSKEMLFDESESNSFALQLRRSERLRQLSHPHLIRYLDVYPLLHPCRVVVVMPYYVEGDLKKFIERQKKPIPELCLCSIVLQIAEALNYLHQQDPPLVHYDIKPDNILLLNHEQQVLLMDLDLCSTADNTGYLSSTTHRRRVSTTFEYRAPELEKTIGSPKTDVFSLGVVTYVLVTLPEFPFVRTDKNEELVLSSPEWTSSALDAAIRRAIRGVVGYCYSPMLVSLIVRMLAIDATIRPTSEEVASRLRDIMESRLRSGEV